MHDASFERLRVNKERSTATQSKSSTEKAVLAMEKINKVKLMQLMLWSKRVDPRCARSGANINGSGQEQL
jgi:hypothetical protein